jgi:hypothetical protein
MPRNKITVRWVWQGRIIYMEARTNFAARTDLEANGVPVSRSVHRATATAGLCPPPTFSSHDSTCVCVSVCVTHRPYKYRSGSCRKKWTRRILLYEHCVMWIAHALDILVEVLCLYEGTFYSPGLKRFLRRYLWCLCVTEREKLCLHGDCGYSMYCSRLVTLYIYYWIQVRWKSDWPWARHLACMGVFGTNF